MDKELLLHEMRQYAFYFDQTRCGACNACTVACKDWNQVNPGPVAWRKQFTHEAGELGNKRFFPLAFSCNHCDEPACVTSCAAEAITKDNSNGIVTIDRSKCLGLKMCITACPWAKPMIADDKQEPTRFETWQTQHPAQKCNMCVTDRLSNNLKPACVLSCLGRALDWGTVEYIKSRYGDDPDFTRLNPTDFPYAYINPNNSIDTGPNLYIKKMHATGGQGGMKVHKSATYTGKSS